MPMTAGRQPVYSAWGPSLRTIPARVLIGPPYRGPPPLAIILVLSTSRGKHTTVAVTPAHAPAVKRCTLPSSCIMRTSSWWYMSKLKKLTALKGAVRRTLRAFPFQKPSRPSVLRTWDAVATALPAFCFNIISILTRSRGATHVLDTTADMAPANKSLAHRRGSCLAGSCSCAFCFPLLEDTCSLDVPLIACLLTCESVECSLCCAAAFFLLKSMPCSFVMWASAEMTSGMSGDGS
mmetsp:Transcript_15922/g.34393  ORF Transcript_15922/g.34393 Transcript_15922/m.34393 type:complete len:236 (-) Transcript_15922:748-1455(-)